MAIYHLSVKNISRSDGRSAVACAAYRSGEKLKDERQGKEQDYTRKSGVEFKKIYAPENAKKELLNREILWNTVEQIETRKNSQLSREFEIAFPCELDQQQREQMLNEFCEKIVDRHNVIVDAVIHAPHTKGGTDERNYHAHIMLTTRSINERGELGKKTREFNDNGKDEVQHWRESFAELCNHHLERIGSSERVSHLSNRARGIDLEPTMHEGSKVTALRREGKDIEISLANDAIRERNAERQLIKGLEQEIIATERLVADLKRERSEQSPQHSIFDKINQNLDVGGSYLNHIQPINKDHARTNLDQVKQALEKAKEQVRKDRLAEAKAIGEQEQRQKENQPKIKKTWSDLTR